jgi:hypothetical protein
MIDREQIIAMAHEVGAGVSTSRMHLDAYPWIFLPDELERFAVLVATAERGRIKTANAPEIEKVNAELKKLSEENTKLWGWYHDAEQHIAILQGRARGETE